MKKRSKSLLRSERQLLRPLPTGVKYKIYTYEVSHYEKDRDSSFYKLKKQSHELLAREKLVDSNLEQIRRNAYDFKKLVIEQKATKPLSSLIKTYINKILKDKKNVLMKLEVKCGALKTSLNRASQVLKGREQNDESLRPIDFKQLKIENVQCQKAISKSNAQLVQTKQLSSNLALQVNTLRSSLKKQLLIQVKLRKEQTKLTQNIRKINLVFEETTKELEVLLGKTRKLQELAERTNVIPTVYDYISAKRKLKDSLRLRDDLQRKIEINLVR